MYIRSKNKNLGSPALVDVIRDILKNILQRGDSKIRERYPLLYSLVSDLKYLSAELVSRISKEEDIDNAIIEQLYAMLPYPLYLFLGIGAIIHASMRETEHGDYDLNEIVRELGDLLLHETLIIECLEDLREYCSSLSSSITKKVAEIFYDKEYAASILAAASYSMLKESIKEVIEIRWRLP